MFLIQNLANGNVELSEDGLLVAVFPPNCEVSQDLTNSKFVVITYQGKAIHSLSCVKSYIVRYNNVDTNFSNGQPLTFAALLLSTVFSIPSGGASASTNTNSYSTSHQNSLVITPATGAVYLLKGLLAKEDTTIELTSTTGLVENGKKTAIYVATGIVMTTPPVSASLNDYIDELEGNAGNAVISYNRIQTFYVNSFSSWDTKINKKIDLLQGEICGILAAPAQLLINYWGGLNFEQL